VATGQGNAYHRASCSEEQWPLARGTLTIEQAVCEEQRPLARGTLLPRDRYLVVVVRLACPSDPLSLWLPPVEPYGSRRGSWKGPPGRTSQRRGARRKAIRKLGTASVRWSPPQRSHALGLQISGRPCHSSGVEVVGVSHWAKTCPLRALKAGI
jgi:hypothetical protein